MKKLILIIIAVIILALGTIYYLSETRMICWKVLDCEISLRNAEKDTSGKIVVLISMDGLRGDLVTNANMPFLYGLLSESTYTLSAQTISQSETLPAHTSMLTGLALEHHGVDWNTMDLTKPYLDVNTVFDYLEDEGVTTLTIVSKNKLLYYNHNEIDKDTYFFDDFSEEFSDKSLEVIPETNGHDMFIFLHYKDSDAVGHVSGWASNEQLKAIRAMDGDVERLYTEVNSRFINDDVAFIFTADHGGRGTGHGAGNPDDLRIPFIATGDNIPDDFEIQNKVNIFDTTCTILTIFKVDVENDLDCSTPSGISL